MRRSEGHTPTLFLTSSGPCSQSAVSKSQHVKGNWLLWNRGWNLKSLNNGGEHGSGWESNLDACWQVELVWGLQQLMGVPSSSLEQGGPREQNGKQGCHFSISSQIFLFPLPQIWQAVPSVSQVERGMISDTSCQLLTSNINGEASRKLEVPSIPTVVLPYLWSFHLCLNKKVSLEGWSNGSQVVKSLKSLQCRVISLVTSAHSSSYFFTTFLHLLAFPIFLSPFLLAYPRDYNWFSLPTFWLCFLPLQASSGWPHAIRAGYCLEWFILVIDCRGWAPMLGRERASSSS